MIDLIQYHVNGYRCVQNQSTAGAMHIIANGDLDDNYWLDVAVKDEQIVAELAKEFNLHDLVLEDIFNHNHLPKYEQYEHYSFLTLKMLSIRKDEDGDDFIEDEQISILFGRNWLITVQETEGDIFDSVRHRLQKSLGNLRRRRTDYLFYRLVDTIVDHYFVVLEWLREKVETLEERLTENPEQHQNEDVLHLKNQLRTLRRFMLPLRTEVNRVRVEPAPFIEKFTLTYINDVYDHLVNLENSFETFREMLNDLTDLHLAYLSHSMNRVMKTLSTVSTIFIPLTFIVGVYGMNFEHMPELGWTWAYPALLGLMLLISLILVWFMRRKGWF